MSTAVFPIGVTYGPANVQAEYTKAISAHFNVTSPTFSPTVTSSSVNAMLALASSNSMNAAVWDTNFMTTIRGPISSTAVNTAVDTLYSNYGSKTATKYWVIVDEPGKTNFDNIQTAATRLKSKNSSKSRYVNLFSSIASCNQLAGTPEGTPCLYTYPAYVSQFLSTATNVNLVTFDHYPFLADGTTQINPWFTSLETIRTQVKNAGRQYGAIIQGSQYSDHRNPNLSESYWQAMTALAYGSKIINWFSWTGFSDPNGVTGIGFGSSTTDLDQISEVNDLMQDYGKFLIKGTSEAIWHVDAGRPPGTSGRPAVDPVTVNNTNVPIYVGRFSTPGKPGKLILVGNRSFSASTTVAMTICPISSTGYLWYRFLETWVKQTGSAGECVTVSLGFAPGRAALLYAE